MFDDLEHEEIGEGLPGFEAEATKSPRKLSDVREELDLDLPVIKAADLVGQPFVIRAAKPWKSPLGKGGTVYFCTCVDKVNGELFQTNLGGQAVVEVLQKVFASGVTEPLEVTLVKHTGGQFGRYYTLE